MFKCKQIAILCIIILILALPLAGCRPSAAPAPVQNAQKGNPPPEINKPPADVPKAGQTEKTDAGNESGSSRPGPVISLPEARADESTAGRVYKPAPGQAKYVYLTFDDGPNTFFTGQVLDILAKRHVKASFMVVGSNAEKNPELIKRMVTEGHAVINHTYTHNYKKIYSSPDALVADLDRASRVLEKIIGHPVKIFRPPGGPGNLSKKFCQRLNEKGYQSVGWNITGGDSDPKGVTPEQVYENVARGLARVERMRLPPIILLHDGTQVETIEAAPNSPLGRYIQNRKSVVDALPKIIELLESKGYTFAVVDEHTPPPW
ncbi:MAG: polysaccharide deacetylase [Armatimonadetes bacterium]|nr:polysaccharide deacetylase [Armatimonadota bacterium]